MYQTNYHRASSVDEAAGLVKKADDGKFVSGGMTLIPAMKQRLASPSDLIDLRHIKDLKGIKVSGNSVTIGATTTHAEVAGNAAHGRHAHDAATFTQDFLLDQGIIDTLFG